MASCDETEWDIELKIDGDPDNAETIAFRNIIIAGGVLVGEVYDEPGEFMSVLRGTCTPDMITGRPDMSHLEFTFNVRDVRGNDFFLRLHGVAYLPVGQPSPPRKEFRGEFRAYQPYSDGTPFSRSSGDPSPSGQLELLAFDEGDTGSGNGQQT